MSEFEARPSEGERPGAYARFPYDRELVQRFRETFPRARWRGPEEGWFVPGTTALRRLDGWIAQELAHLDRHADEKGRDAFLFDPLESRYLTVSDELEVRTPYSRTIVDTMRAIPWAYWDRAGKVWRVPFRSYEELQRRWPVIEDSALRHEPGAKRSRQHSPQSALWQAERRLRRFPVPGDDLPPAGVPVATLTWGVVVFEDVEAAPITDEAAGAIYPHLASDPARFVWGHWRIPSLQEISRTKPSTGEGETAATREERGWWLPSREELRERARRLREIERAQATRAANKSVAEL